MKIKDLGILPKYFSLVESFKDFEPFGPLSWADWILENIDNGKLLLKVRLDLDSDYRGKTREIDLNKRKKYMDLSPEGKRQLLEILSSNVGKSIEEIFDLELK